jgi:hypothetical protein
MSTAILTPPDEITKTEQVKPVTFMARSENQVLTRKKTRHVPDINGERRVQTEEDWRADMQAASDKLVREGKEPLDFDTSPWKIQFQLNQYQTADPVIIDWLRGLDLFNFNGPSGFWELVESVDVNDLEPTAEDQLRELQDALMKHDPDAAEIVLLVEKETHNRPQVLKAAESAVASLRDLIAEATGEGAPSGAPPSTSSS